MSLEKRIRNDIKKLQKNNYVVYNESLDIINIYLLDSFNLLYKIIFKIPISYPFRRPTLFIKQSNYICLLAEMSNGINNKHNEKNCLCCNSILCDESWSPTISMLDIIKEVELMISIYNNKYIRRCYDKINLKRLLKKNLNIDITIIFYEIQKYI
jgi:hypothetical protein